MAIDPQAAERVKVMWRDIVPLQEEPTIDDYRREVAAMYGKFPLADDVETEEVDADGVRSLWIAAPGASDERVLLLYHGGGYLMGTPEAYRDFAYRLSAAADARVFCPDYRVAPEHPYPAPVEDGVTAYRWLAAHVDPARVVTVGDSAGGGLTLAVNVSIRDAGERLPAAIALVSPLTDLAGEGASYDECADRDVSVTRDFAVQMGAVYLGGRDPKQTPLGSPLYAELSGLPPVLAIASAHEALRDDSTRLVDKIRASGGRAELELFDDMQHVFPVFACILPEGREAIERIGAFAKREVAVPVG